MANKKKKRRQINSSLLILCMGFNSLNVLFKFVAFPSLNIFFNAVFAMKLQLSAVLQ